MKIARIEATWVSIPIAQERQHKSDFGQIRTFDSAIVRIDTDQGITGWGEGKNAAGSAGTYAGTRRPSSTRSSRRASSARMRATSP